MNRKRILGALMAGVLSIGLLMSSVSAATITMNDSDGVGAKYSAYQLMELTTSLKAGHEDHEGAHKDDCWNYAYKVTEKYQVILRDIAGVSEEVTDDTAVNAAILAYIGGLSDVEADSNAVQVFADALYRRLAAGGISPDVNEAGSTFEVGQGYYLIVETTKGEDPDSVSLAMLNTAGQDDIKVTTKEDVPTLEKKIVVDDETKQDSDFVGVNDRVKYVLTVEAPEVSVMASYDTYTYIIHDNVSDALKIDRDSVECFLTKVSSGGAITKINIVPDAIKVRANGEETSDSCSMEVVFDDILTKFPVDRNALNTKYILEVFYECEVSADAVTGTPGNPNDAFLEFSNNPYHDGDGETGKTPKDKVTVFTFKLRVDKVDQNQNPLAGAKFDLYKLNPETEEYEKFQDLMVSEDGATFSFSGLDVGDYRLVESETPDGYQAIDPVDFTVIAKADTESGNPQLTELIVMRGEKNLAEGEEPEFELSLTEGSMMTAIVNVTGNRLPSTGGAGVYALYGGGALLVICGACLVIMSNKKKAAEHK